MATDLPFFTRRGGRAALRQAFHGTLAVAQVAAGAANSVVLSLTGIVGEATGMVVRTLERLREENARLATLEAEAAKVEDVAAAGPTINAPGVRGPN